MSTIATTRDYTSKCLNVLLWIKFNHNNFFANMCQSHPFLHAICMHAFCMHACMHCIQNACMHFVCKKGRGHCTFSSRVIIIREGQVILPTRLRYWLDSKRLCTTRITFLANSYIFCSNYDPAIHYSYS